MNVDRNYAKEAPDTTLIVAPGESHILPDSKIFMGNEEEFRNLNPDEFEYLRLALEEGYLKRRPTDPETSVRSVTRNIALLREKIGNRFAQIVNEARFNCVYLFNTRDERVVDGRNAGHYKLMEHVRQTGGFVAGIGGSRVINPDSEILMQADTYDRFMIPEGQLTFHLDKSASDPSVIYEGMSIDKAKEDQKEMGRFLAARTAAHDSRLVQIENMRKYLAAKVIEDRRPEIERIIAGIPERPPFLGESDSDYAISFTAQEAENHGLVRITDDPIATFSMLTSLTEDHMPDELRSSFDFLREIHNS